MIDVRELERFGLFSGLSEEARAEALAAFRAYELGDGEILLEEGESDRGMVIILDGDVSVSLAGVELERLGAGDTAGEMTLFGTFDRRSATVTTLGGVKLLALDEAGIRFLRRQENPVVRELEVRVLRIIGRRLRDMNARIGQYADGEVDAPPRRGSLFSRIANALGVSGDLPSEDPPPAVEVLSRAPGFMGREPAALATIASRLEMVVAAKGENITEAGRRAEDAFMVAEGRVAVLTNVGGGRVERVAVLGPGQMFGHLALADDQGRSATCRALDPTYLLRIPGALYRTYEREDSEEARVFRRALIDALSIQLRLANEHLVTLTKRGA